MPQNGPSEETQIRDENIPGLSNPLDRAQLSRIEAVHRGFLYQHLFAVGCLLQMASSGAHAVVIEHDEDVEVILPKRHIYVQVKTRSRLLRWSDVEVAVERFGQLREAHHRSHRVGTPSFIVVSNTAPGAALRRRIADQSWPADVRVQWPGSTGPDIGVAIPPPWDDIPAALRWCIAKAAEMAFASLSAETLVWKLAARVQYAATGDHGHQVDSADLAALFELLVIQLQDFPAPPEPYRAQHNEPGLDTGARVRLIVGFSGAGKTSWVSQAALHMSAPAAYFDVADLPGPALANSLARELAARFPADRRVSESSHLPVGPGLEMLRALDRQLTEAGSTVTVVIDNTHRLEVTALRSVVEAPRIFVLS